MKNPRRIKADDNLREVFSGKEQVTLLELTRLVNKHLFVGAEEAVVKELAEELLWSAYEVLDCSIDMSDEEIRRKYRDLYQEYHPDRPSHSDLPAGVVKLVEEKFQEIQNAYVSGDGISKMMDLFPIASNPAFRPLRYVRYL